MLYYKLAKELVINLTSSKKILGEQLRDQHNNTYYNDCIPVSDSGFDNFFVLRDNYFLI